jgi:hypothetical protein
LTKSLWWPDQQDLFPVDSVRREHRLPKAHYEIPELDSVVNDNAVPDKLSLVGAISDSDATSSVLQAFHAEQFETEPFIAAAAEIPEIRPPRSDEKLLAQVPRTDPVIRFARMTGVLLATLGIGFVGGWTYYELLNSQRGELSGGDAIATVVERIVQAESNGCATLKNTRSTATGSAQFLDETWLRLIRAHRRELAGRSEKELLEMRRDPELSREMTARFAHRNAEILRKRGLSVTLGTLYLSHFAGSAGAVAILSAPDSADAASIMAGADTTGRSTRDKIIFANPFLQQLTISDLKSWAERKMNTREVNQICGRPSQNGPVRRLQGGAAKS